MASAAVKPNPGEPELADVQGLVRRGFGTMKRARYELLRIEDVEAARAWLRSAEVATAESVEPPPTSALQIAFTAEGLARLGVASSTLEQFSHEFRTGMATDYRARQLGDVGLNAADNWRWGSRGREPHLLVMLFAQDERLDDFVRSVRRDPWDRAFSTLPIPDVAELSEFEPFGFADGISQPRIDWQQERRTPTTQLEYTNLTALGEFLLGYPNEYGRITDRPLLEPRAATADLLPALEAPEMKDLARNGTYLVMRQLEQDVWGFWQYVKEQAGGDDDEAERLASAMVGRTPEGQPLLPQQTAVPGEHGRRNSFTFDGDPEGIRCPFGAHIRRANPRNFDYPTRPSNPLAKLIVALGFGPLDYRYDTMSSVRFHRVLRRGRGYGPVLERAAARAAAAPDGQERGLHFICLNANIQRQFEFVQNAWMASSKFAAMSGETDPLIAARQPQAGCPVADSFNMPQPGGLRRRLSKVPQFVTVRGGAYFFLPSVRALSYLASEGSG